MENQSSTTNKEYINISNLLHTWLKHWYLFALIILGCCILGFVYFKLATPTYSVSANILVQEEDKSSIGNMQAALMNSFSLGSMFGSSQSINDELHLISSFSLFREVAKEQKLNVTYKSGNFFNSNEHYLNSPLTIKSVNEIADTLTIPLKFKIKVDKSNNVSVKVYTGFKKRGEVASAKLPARVSTDVGDFVIEATGFYIPGEKQNIKASYISYDLAAESLQEMVNIDLVSKKANIINLQIDEKNTQKGKDILNSIIRIYNQTGNERKNLLASSTLYFLDERLNIISTELDDIERNIEAYKKENSLTDIEAEAKIILDKSNDFKEKLIEAEAQYTVIELVENFLELPENKYSLVPLNIGLSDRTVLEGLQKYNDALLERMKLLKTTQSNNPIIEILNEQINAMRDNMLATIRSLKSGFLHTRENLRTQESYFISRIKGMPTQEREFTSIKRQQLIKQELYVFLLQKKEENALNLAISKPKAQIVDAAYSQSKPVKPKLKIILLIMIVMGGCISIGVISLKQRFSKNS